MIKPMGFLSKIFGASQPPATPAPQAPTLTTPPRVPPTKVTGTTTYTKDGAHHIATLYDLRDNGHLETTGQIIKDTANPVDSHAVAVTVMGEIIGYLPAYLAHSLPLPDTGAQPVEVQVFTTHTTKGLRVECWVRSSASAGEWEYTTQQRPPMSAQQQRLDRQNRAMLHPETQVPRTTEQRATPGAGYTDSGLHYLELVEPINQLKRDGNLEAALDMALAAVHAAEEDKTYLEANGGFVNPPPAYTRQAAIILRKLKHTEEEIALLQRYINYCSPEFLQRNKASRELVQRLEKLTASK